MTQRLAVPQCRLYIKYYTSSSLANILDNWVEVKTQEKFYLNMPYDVISEFKKCNYREREGGLDWQG